MEPIDWGAIHQRAEQAGRVPSEGEHILTCTRADWDWTQTGKRMIRYTYAVAQGPEQGVEVQGQQVLTEDKNSAVRIFCRYMDAHGVTEDVRMQATDPNQLTAMMVGQSVLATVKHRLWQGEVQADLENFRPASLAPQGVAMQAAPQAAPVAPQQAPQPQAVSQQPMEPQVPQGAPVAPQAQPMAIPQPAPQPQAQAPAPQPVPNEPVQGQVPPEVAQAQQQTSEFLAGDPAQMFQQN